MHFEPSLANPNAIIKEGGKRCSFSNNDQTALLNPTLGSTRAVSALALIIKREGGYSAQVGLASPSADMDKGIHQQDGLCLWSGNVYINGTRKRVGFDGGSQPLLIWRANTANAVAQSGGGRAAAWTASDGAEGSTLSVYCDTEQRVSLPVPAGATHFAVSGDINGIVDFEIDDARTAAAQEAAEKGEEALDSWLQEEADRAVAAASSGGCCLIA